MSKKKITDLKDLKKNLEQRFDFKKLKIKLTYSHPIAVSNMNDTTLKNGLKFNKKQRGKQLFDFIVNDKSLNYRKEWSKRVLNKEINENKTYRQILGWPQHFDVVKNKKIQQIFLGISLKKIIDFQN